MEIRPAPPPPLPDKLPFEDAIDRFLKRLSDAYENTPIIRFIRKVEEKLPVIEGVKWPTPLGVVETPRFELPSLTPPKIDDRRREAIKAAIGDDLASLLSLASGVAGPAAPVVELISDVMEDIYMHKLRESLRDDEMELFSRLDKSSPSTTVALIQTFTRRRL